MSKQETIFDGLEELILKRLEQDSSSSIVVFDTVLTLVKLLESKGVIEYDEYILKLKEDLQKSLEESK